MPTKLPSLILSAGKTGRMCTAGCDSTEQRSKALQKAKLCVHLLEVNFLYFCVFENEFPVRKHLLAFGNIWHAQETYSCTGAKPSGLCLSIRQLFQIDSIFLFVPSNCATIPKVAVSVPDELFGFLEWRLPGYKNTGRNSQDTHYVSATEPSQLTLCKI
jgi:hypothetical protein